MTSIERPDIDLRQLATFRAAARALSFSRAATALHYAQSTVSAQIHSLEERLGVALFDRLGRQVVLTDAGRRLLPWAERLLALSAEAHGDVTGDAAASGTLTISTRESLCAYRLPPVLREFRRRCPEVQLAFGPSEWRDLHPVLSEGRADVALELRTPFDAPGLVVEPLVEEPLRLVAPPGHPLCRARRVRLGDLRDEPLLLTESGCSYRTLFEQALAAAGVRPATALEFHSVEAIKQCVMAGVGLAILPAMAVAREIESGRLSPLRCRELKLTITTWLVWHGDRWLSPAAQTFVDVCRELLRGAGLRTARRPRRSAAGGRATRTRAAATRRRSG